MFTDAAGRDWPTKITVGAVERVKDMTGVLLTDVADGGDLIARLNTDVVCLANVLFAVCKPTAEDRGISAAEFGESLYGDAIDKAYASLMDDLIAFFPHSRRTIAQKLRTATEKISQQQDQLLNQKLTDDQLDKIIRREMEKLETEIDTYLAELGESSGKSPAS